MSSASTLMLSGILVAVCLTLLGVSLYNLNLSLRVEHNERARQLAESAVALATARILADSGFGSGAAEPPLTVESSEPGAAGLLSFSRGESGSPYSTNNLEGDADVPGWAGQVVPAHSAHLVGQGHSGGVTRRVQVLLRRPAYPYAVACAGPVFSAGSLHITGAPDVQTGLPAPAHLISNSVAPEAVRLGPQTVISGDVRSAGGVALDPQGSQVLGHVVQTARPVSIPRLNLSAYDPQIQGRSQIQAVAQANVNAPVVSGYSRRQGDLCVTGGLTLDNGVLYVDGNVEIFGGVRGVGALVITGNAALQGATDLSADDRLALVCGRSLQLRGSGSQQATFQRLVYAGESFRAEQVTLRGTLLVQEGPGQTQLSTLNGLSLIHQPELSRLTLSAPATSASTLSFTSNGQFSGQQSGNFGEGSVQIEAHNQGGLFTWRNPTSGVLSSPQPQATIADQIWAWMQTRPGGSVVGTRAEIMDALAGLAPTAPGAAASNFFQIDPSEFLPPADRIRVVYWRED